MSQATSEAQTDAHGPVDFLLIEFPADRLTGEVAPRLVDLVESGIIRLYDLMVISKAESGAVEAIELRDSPVAQDFQYFAGASSGLLDDDDMRQAAEAMDPGTVAALLVYEQSLVAADDLTQVKRAFDLNGYVGLVYLAGTAIALYVG